MITIVVVRFDEKDAETMTVFPGWSWHYPDAPDDWTGPISGGPFTLRGLALDLDMVFGEVAP